jgi:alpha-N-arabinofuranosidase
MSQTMIKPFACLIGICILLSADAAESTLTIDTANPVGKVSPRFYGLMTEEINFSYDGGLYAELVRNRAFMDDPEKPAHWSVVQQNGSEAVITLDPKQPFDTAIPTSLRLDVKNASTTAPAGVANSGYWGIPVKPGIAYYASFHAKAASDFGPINVSIVSEDGATVYAKATVSRLTGDWKNYEATLKTDSKITATDKAHLLLSVERPGTVWLSLVSLFPPTWKNQPNGFRPDLMQMLVDLNPKFLRFPGGNYVEGDTIETRFDWKKTIGPITERPGHQSPWGYRSSDGMGLMEFLRWCEDMGAEPVLAVYAGYSLKGAHVKPGPDLEPYVQDALDEIEYVTGDKASKWGAQRVKDGHAKPFPLHYVEIGNEDWFDKSGSYDGRFAQFSDAIKAKYPELKCISTVGNEQPASKRVHSRQPDVLDEHYYRNASTFLSEGHDRFEKYDRKGPEIFVGEWASYETSFPPWDKRSAGEPPTPRMRAAIGDAAWMAAMERNAELIKMNCYAPLFVNINGRQWRPDLIGYDALRSYGSPSYYAFKMFSRNVGDELLKATSDSTAIHWTVTRNSKNGEMFIKLVNPETEPQSVKVQLKGVSSVQSTATALTLAAGPEESNSIDNPTHIVPVASRLSDVKPEFNYLLPANSIAVLTVKTR